MEDLWALGRVGAPAVSPDGSSLVVAVTRHDMEKNEGQARLWRMDTGAAGAASRERTTSQPAAAPPQPLTTDEFSSHSPAWSPDGRRLAFIRSKPGEKGQLYLMSLEGGEPEKLTDAPLGCFDPRWFPDGRRIAVVAPVYREAPTLEGTRELLETHRKNPVKAYATEDRLFRYWDRWLTDGDVPHLFIVDLATRAMRDVIPDSTRWFDLMEPGGQYDISPDGLELAFSANASRPPHTRTNWDIFVVSAEGGEARNLTERNPLDDHRPRYSPDGRSILYGMQVKYGFYADKMRLALYHRSSGQHEVLTEDWDRSAAGWEFAPDGARIFFHAEDRGRNALFSLAPQPGTPVEIHRGGSVHDLSVARDGRLYFLQDSLMAPPEVAACGPRGEGFRWVSSFNAERLTSLDLGAVRELEFPGAEGRAIQMFLVLPPGFDESRPWPLVHMIHGGPHGVFGDQFHFRWNAHLFASPGYVVALVNFHGSTSWGQEFAECIQGAWGDRPYRDLMAATDMLERLPWIDRERMAATGGSYGGYMVSWIAGHTDRFACLINHAGVSDLMGEYASDVTHGWEIALGGSPWSDLPGMDRWNPIRSAAGFKTPMLVIHGEKDYRVPYQQGLEIYNVYKAMELPARLVVFPDENHWVLKPQNSRLWYREVHAWLARYLRREEAPHAAQETAPVHAPAPALPTGARPA